MVDVHDVVSQFLALRDVVNVVNTELIRILAGIDILEVLSLKVRPRRAQTTFQHQAWQILTNEQIKSNVYICLGFPNGAAVKNLPAVQEI